MCSNFLPSARRVGTSVLYNFCGKLSVVSKMFWCVNINLAIIWQGNLEEIFERISNIYCFSVFHLSENLEMA